MYMRIFNQSMKNLQNQCYGGVFAGDVMEQSANKLCPNSVYKWQVGVSRFEKEKLKL